MPNRLHPSVYSLQLNISSSLRYRSNLLSAGTKSVHSSSASLKVATRAEQALLRTEVDRVQADKITYLQNQNASLQKEIVTLNTIVFKQS